MSAPLAARAAEMAKATNGNARPPAEAADVRSGSPGLPDVELGESPDDWDKVPVHIAWLRLRREILFLPKSQEYLEEYGPNRGQVRYNFRGVDLAVNAFGPATLKHGISIFSWKVRATYRDTKTSTGKNTRECTVNVLYRIIGPMGDFLEVESAGESLDTGDKGTSKAMSVALRILLLHGGLVPTGDPDPDAGNVERGEAQVRSAASYRDEVLHPGTTRERMHQIRRELIQHRMIGASVENEAGQPEPIGSLIDRVGRERFARPAAQPQPPQPPAPDDPQITDARRGQLHAAFRDAGIEDRDERLAIVSGLVGRTVPAFKDLRQSEATQVNQLLEGLAAEGTTLTEYMARRFSEGASPGEVSA